MDNVIDVTEETFEFDVIQRSLSIPVVVDFWAPWCGPCRMLGPILEQLATEGTYNFILAKINVDNNPNISMKYQVQGIPAVKAFLDGNVVDGFVGAQPESRVRDFLAKLAPSGFEEQFLEAKSLLVIRQYEQAEAAFRAILENNPDHQPSMFQLALALLHQGRGCTAIGYLQDVQDGSELIRAETLTPLARFFCAAETGWSDADDISNEEAQYRQAGRLLKRGNLEAGLDGLLDVLRLDKRYKNGEAKEVAIAVFELLGEQNEITQAYRKELASILF